MFPSTGHFKSLHCPFHLEGECGRIYCHYRHAKNVDERSGENNSILALERQICKDLNLEKDAFDSLINEEKEDVHEKLLTEKLKTLFPNCDKLLDNLRLPEISKDNWDLSVNDAPLDPGIDDLKNLKEPVYEAGDDDDTPLDESPLKQFLEEEDAKRKSNTEQSKPNTLEKRHIIISCLEKIEKRSEFHPRRVGTIRPKKFASVDNVNNELVKEAPIKGEYVPSNCLVSSKSKPNVKQEDPGSDNSSDEDAAEVDSLLTQISLLNPQLFSSADKSKEERDSYDFEAADSKTHLYNESSSSQLDFSELPTQPYPGSRPYSEGSGDGRSASHSAGQRNLVCRDSSSVRIKRENDDLECTQVMPPSINRTSTASIAEQNRVKNLFKNTICSNIDKFFDLSDACKVYGTEIFNLLEPVFTYLVEKLNPQFNFAKIRQLHSQNISLVDGLPFVCTCEHLKSCIECYNVMLCAVSKCNVRTIDKSTETSKEMNSEIPLRKIEAGLNHITKEIMSLGIPVDSDGKPIVKPELKHVKCQTNFESKSHPKSSSYEKRHNEVKHHSSRHKSKTEPKSSSHKKEHSSEKRSSSHSSRHKTSKSRSDEKKRKKESASEEGSSSDDDSKQSSKYRRSSSSVEKSRKRSSSDRVDIASKKPKVDSKHDRHEKKPARIKESSPERIEISDDSDFGNGGDALESESSNENYSDIDQIGADDDNQPSVDFESGDDSEPERTAPKTSSENSTELFSTTASKKRLSHVTEDKVLPYNRKPFVKKTIPTPSEVLFQRMQQKEAEKNAAAAEAAALQNSNERVRISHVPNVALLLKAKERLKNDLFSKPKPPTAPVRTTAQTTQKGRNRTAHIATEVPPSKEIPAHATSLKPKIDSYKANNNIPLPTRQNSLDRLFGAFSKKVPPELASELALKEERNIHEKVTIVKVYLNSLAMALHRISKEDPAKLLEKNSDFPTEINGFSVYDLLNRHILTREQLEVNGFPIPIPYQPGCCGISTKAIHYKPLTSKRSGDKFYCLQCKEPFEMCPETGLPLTPTTGCKFHTLRPRKEPGRLRHELFYPCCNKSITESGCMMSEYHTPDTTDDDCLENFVETRDPPPGDPGARQFYSLDCEMCYTTAGSELTRVTVIKYDCGVIYDSLVKPRNRILDYCTKFSGITEEKLRYVKKTLEEVRRELLKFIFKDTILIGHSLENDLKALKIQHNKIVDTSVMYPHRDAPERKFSLKFLSSNLVHYLIQESEFGHDSKEDAVACMKLVWKKIREDAQVHRPKKIIGSPERGKN